MFEVKDFENLYRLKLKSGFTAFSDFDITTSYFANIDNKIIFIKKSRRFYKVCASSNTGFEPIFRESCFDVLYHSTDLSCAVEMFKGYIQRLCK